MRYVLGSALVGLLLWPACAAAADDVKLDDLLGKWELTEEIAKLPKGSTFDFQKDGKLVVSAEVGGERRMFEFRYELKSKERVMAFTVGGTTQATVVATLDSMNLVLQDKDGTSPRFKRVK